MKVGILTYHRAENYGALLQAFALKTYLSQMGHDVSFVDYWPEYHKDYFRIFPRMKFKKGGFIIKIYCLYMAIVWGLARYKRKKIFSHFISEKLSLPVASKYSKASDVCSSYDVVYFGSDQIWRKQGLPGFPGRDSWYFGKNIVAKKVAYAASIGASVFEETEASEIKQALASFQAVSVREKSLQNSLEALGIPSTLVVDPVFLLAPKRWRELAKEVTPLRGNYILLYNLLDSQESQDFAKTIANEKGLPIKEITKVYGFNRLGRRYLHHASVQEFLSLIDNADVVVSNSFHGVAFSILFEKQFYAVGMGNKADRVLSLLKQLKLDHRYVSGSIFDSTDIDYSGISELLKQYKSVSESFIDRTI